MQISLLFWLALLIPGYVIVRRCFKDDLCSGLLGVISLSYLTTLGFLSPVSILCYLTGAPLGVFSGACALAVVAGAMEITRRGWWREVGKLLVAGLGVEFAIVLADVLAGAWIGADAYGDIAVHFARIRTLLDHGFNNGDPFVAGDYFFPIYHTNLYHALHAACSHLTGIHYTKVWFGCLPWAKLLIASGFYYMSWCVFERRWVAWVTVLFVVGAEGPVRFVLYPNKLAPLWLLPMMIGFAIQAWSSRCTWRSPLKLAVGSLVLGQVHSLYALFAGIVLGPVLAAAALRKMIRRQPDRWWMGACATALVTAAPFLIISKTTVETGSHAQASAEDPIKKHGPFRHFENGWVMMKPRSGWGTVDDWRAGTLAVGVVCALTGARRRQAGVLLAIVGTAALILYIPPLCTVALRLLKEGWLFNRFSIILYLGYAVLVPASIAYLAESKTGYGWVRSILSVSTLLFGATFVHHNEPYTWPSYYAAVTAPEHERKQVINIVEQFTAFFEKSVPRGETILADPWMGTVLVSYYDCRVVAPFRGSLGVPDLGQREKDLKTMLAATTPWKTRRALLKKYGITHYYPMGTNASWARGRIRKTSQDGAFTIFVLNTESN